MPVSVLGFVVLLPVLNGISPVLAGYTVATVVAFVVLLMTF